MTARTRATAAALLASAPVFLDTETTGLGEHAEICQTSRLTIVLTKYQRQPAFPNM